MSPCPAIVAAGTTVAEAGMLSQITYLAGAMGTSIITIQGITVQLDQNLTEQKTRALRQAEASGWARINYQRQVIGNSVFASANDLTSLWLSDNRSALIRSRTRWSILPLILRNICILLSAANTRTMHAQVD